MTPQQHLVLVGAEYPNAWKYLDEVRAGRERDGLPGWPRWCFAPMAATLTWLRTVAPGHSPRDVSRIATLGAWRPGQGIYRLAPRLAEALIATPLAGDIPCSALLNLPEWAVYIETPGIASSAGFRITCCMMGVK